MVIGIIANIDRHISAFWLALGRDLEELGHKVFFAASGELDDPRYSNLTGLSRRPSLANIKAPSQLREWVTANGIDVAITNTATVSFVTRLSRLPVPVVYFAHGLHWAVEKGAAYRFWSTLEKVALNRSEAMILLNQEDVNWVERNGYKNPTMRLEFGVGLPIEKFSRTPLPSGRKAVWIGEFSKRKDPITTVRAAASIVHGMPGFELAMLGRGALREECIVLARNLGLSDVVSFPGHVDPASYIDGARVLIHSAEWEGLPRVVLESLAVGRPVVALDAKGLRGIDGVNLVPSRDPDDLAKRVIQVLSAAKAFVSNVPLHALSTRNAATEIDKLLRRSFKT